MSVSFHFFYSDSIHLLIIIFTLNSSFPAVFCVCDRLIWSQMWAQPLSQTWVLTQTIPLPSTPSTQISSGTLWQSPLRQVGVRHHACSCTNMLYACAHIFSKSPSFSPFATGVKLPCYWGGLVLSAPGLDASFREAQRIQDLHPKM